MCRLTQLPIRIVHILGDASATKCVPSVFILLLIIKFLSRMKDILKDIIGVHCHKFGPLYFAIDYIQHPDDDVFITSLVGVTMGSMLCQRATHNLVK